MHNRMVIINADGLGFTAGVTRGIDEALATGLVRSASITPNFGELQAVSRVAADHSDASFGIHFNVNVGRPVAPPSEVPSLLDDDGQFWSSEFVSKLMSGRIRVRELRRELQAQLDLVRAYDIPLTHWDAHQNKHLYPRYFSTVADVARRGGIRGVRSHRRLMYGLSGPLSWTEFGAYYVRHPSRAATHAAGRWRTRQYGRLGFRCADTLVTPGYAGSDSKAQHQFWRSLPQYLPPGIHEVYCHPGYASAELAANSYYVEEREAELEILTDVGLADHLRDEGVELASFHTLMDR